MNSFAWFVIGLLAGTYAYHIISGWNAKRRPKPKTQPTRLRVVGSGRHARGSEAKREEKAFRNADGLLQIAEGFNRPKQQPKTTTNVRKLQSHRAALLELCTTRGLGVEAQELIEHIDTEMEIK